MLSGILKKMSFEFEVGTSDISPRYHLDLSSNIIDVNRLVSNKIKISYTGKIVCINCGKTTKKSFGQGYCYPCFISIPQTEDCVLKPELCRAHEGIARNMDYARENCLVEQYVYLALSGGLKVGVTRYHQIPTRWVDQGASYAIKVAIAPNRYTAGLLEVELKKIFADKTNWRKMLMGNDLFENLLEKKTNALNAINGKELDYAIADNTQYSINYPVSSFPLKVNSMSLDKQNEIEGVIAGIKGQYIIFTDGNVFNVRNHSGYYINLTI